MEYNIKSPEFAKAWRIVSEALLAYLQQGGTLPSVVPLETAEDTFTVPAPAQEETPVTAQGEPSDAPRTVLETMYSTGPNQREDGKHVFRVRGLRDERKPNHLYQIIIYSDNTCEFDLCQPSEDDSTSDFRSYINMELVKDSAVSHVGELTATCQITTIQKGKGVKDDREILITEPLKIEFK